MKRTLAFIFACSLLFTLSVGVLAATDVEYPVDEIYDVGYLLDEDDSYVDFSEELDDSVPYGETIYYPLLSDSGSGYAGVHESTATRGIKIRTDWDGGSSYIDKLSVVKKRFIGTPSSNIDLSASKYCYFLAIKTKTRSSTTTAKNDVYGTVKLRKSGDYGFDYDDMQVEVDFEVGYTAPEDSNVIPITPALFVPEEDFDEYDDETFDFEADSYSYFVVNTNNQKKIVLGMDTDYDDDIADKYPNANLDFFNGNGATFNKLGYLYLNADRSSYVYEVEDNNTLKKINASYDSYDDAFVIRTRTLGRYVVSDMKLKVAEQNTNTDDDDTAVIYDNDTQTNYNPGTGGFGFDHIAYGIPSQTQAPAVANNPVSTAPAVINNSSTPASTVEQSDDDSPTIIGTTKKTENKLSAPTVTNPAVSDATTATDYRRLAMIVCSIGALLSVIGLVICALVNFSRSRQRYY
ncbi:hypothetical protein ACS3UN_06785 [Oscillospiraceae bacterium LTW-04]|nr:hypothetical protein RBH76_03575 [Oscillospiraceae bacterium MB24-C1]